MNTQTLHAEQALPLPESNGIAKVTAILNGGSGKVFGYELIEAKNLLPKKEDSYSGMAGDSGGYDIAYARDENGKYSYFRIYSAGVYAADIVRSIVAMGYEVSTRNKLPAELDSLPRTRDVVAELDKEGVSQAVGDILNGNK